MSEPDRREENHPAGTADAVLEIFMSEPSSRLTFQQISAGLDGEHPDLAGAVDRLVGEGLLWPAGGRRYALASALGIVRGRITIRSDGSGFVRSGGERIELDGRNTSGALDGDTVIVRKLQDAAEPGTFRGKVESVAVRSRTGVSGVARKRGGRWVIDPVDPALPRNIPLRTGPRPGVSQGRLVYAEFDYRADRLSAILRRDVGSPDSPGALIDSVVLDHGLPCQFEGEVSQAAGQAAAVPWEGENREDFRDLFTITVDPVDARDFDDAISMDSSGEFRTLYVHIADVARYVPHGSLLDREARLRGTSVYLPDRVIPMLPEILSNGACSLRPGEDRVTRTVIMKFDAQGKRVDFSIVPSVIRSDRRLTYEEALEYLSGGGSDHGLKNLFRDLGRLSEDLDAIRDQRGALDLDTSEYRVLFDGDNRPEGFMPVPSDISHRMIENFMVEANRAVADHCSWGGLPVLYRVHEKPAENSVEKLMRKLDEFDISLPGGKIHSPANLRNLLEGIQNRALRDLVSEHVLRSLQKAVYSPVNQGHFGLALRSYMHFTSPIRRYPDLLVHQVLSMQERGEVPSVGQPLDQLALSSCASEDNAESAERDSVELMALLFLSRRIGSVHEGVVTGVKSFGVFVRLEDVPVEGLAHRSDIRKSGIPFQGTGGLFHEGTPVKVAVLSADVMERKLSLITIKD